MVRKMNEEILVTNKNAILLIEQKKAKELEEEEKRAMYVKEKADKEAEIQAEQKYLSVYVGESRTRKKKKYKNLENSKKKPQTDRLN